jgi:hypothetical protein
MKGRILWHEENVRSGGDGNLGIDLICLMRKVNSAPYDYGRDGGKYYDTRCCMILIIRLCFECTTCSLYYVWRICQ